MTKIYYMEKNGVITQSAGFKFNPACKSTTKNIIRGIDGKLYIDGTQPDDSAERFDEARKKKMLEIQAADAAYRQTGTVEVDGMRFSISNDAKVNLMAVMMLAQTTGTDVDYYEKNGTKHTFSAATFMPVAIAISTAIKAAETNYYAYETRIYAAQTLEEVEAIKWQN